MIVAEKGDSSTWHRIPIQSHYRSEADWGRFLELVAAIRASQRPLHMGEGGTGEPIEGSDGAWRSCGWW